VQNLFEPWLNRPVILQVATVDVLVPVRGVIVGESTSAVRIRVEDRWDFDVFKNMIFAVGPDIWPTVPT
jgi:hypothetical protein